MQVLLRLLLDRPVSMATIVRSPPTLPLWLPPAAKRQRSTRESNHTHIERIHLDTKDVCIYIQERQTPLCKQRLTCTETFLILLTNIYFFVFFRRVKISIHLLSRITICLAFLFSATRGRHWLLHSSPQESRSALQSRCMVAVSEVRVNLGL